MQPYSTLCSCFVFWLQRYLPTILKPIVCVFVCWGLFPSWWWQFFRLPVWRGAGESNSRQVTLIHQVNCLRLMWPLDGQPEDELQEGSVGDKLHMAARTDPAGGIRSSWSWITFTDWIRNLQLFEMNWMWTSPRDSCHHVIAQTHVLAGNSCTFSWSNISLLANKSTWMNIASSISTNSFGSLLDNSGSSSFGWLYLHQDSPRFF